MKNKKTFIFLTSEGICFSPNNDFNQQAVENWQVIGWADGIDADESFKRLINENKSLIESGFNEIFAFELVERFQEQRRWFSLNDYKKLEYPA